MPRNIQSAVSRTAATLALAAIASTSIAAGAAWAGSCSKKERTYLGERVAVDTTVKNRTSASRFYVDISARTGSKSNATLQTGIAQAGGNVSALKKNTQWVVPTITITKATLVADGTAGAQIIDGFSFVLDDSDKITCTYEVKLGGSVTQWKNYSCTGTPATFKMGCDKSWNTSKGRWNTDFKLTDK